jgi:hypothetical protein
MSENPTTPITLNLPHTAHLAPYLAMITLLSSALYRVAPEVWEEVMRDYSEQPVSSATLTPR